jgi:hypothetical protein
MRPSFICSISLPLARSSALARSHLPKSVFSYFAGLLVRGVDKVLFSKRISCHKRDEGMQIAWIAYEPAQSSA